jgi:DNA-binding NarL/FixJ family response regulator
MTLVVIGRESPVRERLVAELRELDGVEVVVRAPRTDDIRSTIHRLSTDAFLIDIQQEEAGGLKLIRAIRDLKNGRSPVIIALSSGTSLQYRMKYRVKCHEAGATFFFDTSSDQESLLGAVRSIRLEIDHHAGVNNGSKSGEETE